MRFSVSKPMMAGIAAILTLGIAACEPKREARPVCDFHEYEDALQNPPTGEVMVPVVPGTISEMPLNTVNVTDGNLLRKIMVQATNASRTETGQVEVWARLVNCTDFALVVEARTNFLTATQAPAEPVTAWNRQVVAGHQIFTYTTKSISGPNVASYLIEVRQNQ